MIECGQGATFRTQPNSEQLRCGRLRQSLGAFPDTKIALEGKENDWEREMNNRGTNCSCGVCHYGPVGRMGGVTMGSIVGDILTPILVFMHFIWDKKHGGLRGIWLQALGAFCVGWAVNLLLNVRTAPIDPYPAILCVTFFAVMFYVIAGSRRKK